MRISDWSSDVCSSDLHRRVVADWTLIGDESSARALAGTIAEAPISTGLWTSISGVMAFVLPRFDGNGFEGVRRVIDISGDGPTNNGDPLQPERARALAAGVTIKDRKSTRLNSSH